MYRKRDDLTSLVKSLSNGEKRFLNNTFSLSEDIESKPMYLELFEKLRVSKSDNPNNNSEIFGKVLTTKKRFLYKVILRNLRQLHDEQSVNIIIQNRLTDIEILYNHSLPEQALVLLNKTHKTATENEKFGLMLQLLDWEKRLNIAMEIPTRSIEAIQAEEKAVMEKLTEINNLASLYSHIMQLKKQYGYVKGKAKKMLEDAILHSPNFVSEEHCKSQKASYYRNLTLSVYYWMSFEHFNAFEISKKLLTDPMNNILINDYVNGLLQHITSCVCITEFNDALKGINLSQLFIDKNYLNESNPFKHLYFAYSISYSLIVYGYQGDKVNTKSILLQAERKLPQYTSLPQETRHVMLGNMMNAYISIGAMDEAEAIWNELFSLTASKIRKDIYADLFLVRIFFLIQNQKYDLIPPIVDAALRYYRNASDTRLQFDVEVPICLLLDKELNFENQDVLTKVLNKCSGIVSEFIDKLNMPVPFQEHYSRYIIWINAIENNVPYYEAAKEWYESLERSKGAAASM